MCHNLHVGSINTYYVSSQTTEQQTFTSGENMCMQQGGIATNERTTEHDILSQVSIQAEIVCYYILYKPTIH